jgi:hypothetical protein
MEQERRSELKAFLIDPKERTITEVSYDGNLEHMYELLSCRSVDAVQINSDRDTIYIDDEGMFVEDQSFFYCKSFQNPLAGRGLVVGTDDEGSDIEPKVSLEELLDDIYFGFLMRTRKGVDFIGDPARTFCDKM